MADSYLRDKRVYLSKTREGTYNTAVTGGSNYLQVWGKTLPEMLPEPEQITNEGTMGFGHTGITKVCQFNWKMPTFPFAGEIDSFTDFVGRQALRAVGGEITITEPEAGSVYLHTAAPLSTYQLPGTSIVYAHDANSFLYAGGVTKRFKISRTGMTIPNYEIDIVSTGKITTPHGITSLPSSAPTLDCVDPHNCSFTWTDAGSATTNFGTDRRLSDFSFEYDNQVIIDDVRQGESASGASGGTLYHRGYILRGEPKVTASVRLAFTAADIDEWDRMAKNQTFTDGIFKVQGSVAGGSTRYGITMTIPTFKLGSPVNVTSNNEVMYGTFNLIPLRSSSIGGYATIGVTNVTPTAYV